MEKEHASHLKNNYLYRLAKALLTGCSYRETADILQDIRLYFIKGEKDGRSDSGLILALGTPKSAAKELLCQQDQKELRIDRAKKALLLVCAIALFSLFLTGFSALSPLVTAGFTLALNVLLFFLFNVRALCLFSALQPKKGAALPICFHILTFLLTLFPLVFYSYLLTHIHVIKLPSQTGVWMSLLFRIFLAVFIALLLCTLILTLFRSVSFFGAGVHACGALGTLLCINRFFHSLSGLSDALSGLSWCMLPYIAGLFSLLLFTLFSKRWLKRSERLWTHS